MQETKLRPEKKEARKIIYDDDGDDDDNGCYGSHFSHLECGEM